MLNLEDTIQVRLSKLEYWWRIDPNKYGGERPWIIPLVGSDRAGVGLCLNQPISANYANAFDLMAYIEAHPAVLPQVIRVYPNPLLPSKVFQSEGEVIKWLRKNENKLFDLAEKLLYSDELIRITAEATPHLGATIPRCERCNNIWTLWMVQENVWKKIAGKWSKKRLCWRCFTSLCKKKQIRVPRMLSGYDWSMDISSED